MSRICGWLGASQPRSMASDTIDAMAQAGRSQAGASIAHVHADTAALAAVSALVPTDLYQGEGLLAAVDGQVTWTAAEFADIAREHGSAAALASAYARYGPQCLTYMRGPFAVAVLDVQGHRALLAIDRVGIRGLCFAQQGNQLVFGTRVDQVVAHPGVQRAISRQGVFNYLYCHVVPSPGTIYEGVTKLQPGERLIFDNGKLRRDFYWHLAYLDQPDRPVPELEEGLRDLLRAGVERAIRDESVGAFLSGGTDSSMVAGMLTKLRGAPVDTYSIGFAAEGFDEMEYARITARHFGTKAHEYYVTPGDLVDAIPKIAAACDEPFGNASVVAALCCAKMAHADGKRLLLAGDGGDEIFGGNARYAKQKVFEAYWLLPSSLRRHFVEPVALGLPGAQALPALRKLQSYIRQARVPLPDRLETYNFLQREALEGILESEFLRSVDRNMPATIAREVYERTASRSAINRMMHLDLKLTLADNDLRKVNVACEVAGVAVSYPLLDEDLVEFSGLVPPGQKVKGLKLRYLFKHALKDFLPPETLTKSKHGFGLPFGLWLQHDQQLRALAQDSLASLRARGFVRPAYIDQLSAMHSNEHASYYGVMIWVLMMFEHWLRTHEP